LESIEIAERSGLSITQVEAISQQCDWRGIDLHTAKAFMQGCGCDITDRGTYRRMREYIKAAPRNPVSRFPYLRRSERWDAYYLPLLERFAQHLRSCRTTRQT
jgi:hypothetical protein